MANSKRYSHLLKPFQLPNGVILKNRIMVAAATNNFLQGKLADYPTDPLITMVAGRAKHGAALITLTGQYEKHNIDFYHGHAASHYRNTFDPEGYAADQVFTFFDLTNKSLHCAFNRLTEEVHLYQSKIVMQILPALPEGYNIDAGNQDQYFIKGATNKEIPASLLEEVLEDHVEWARLAKLCGFDGICLHSWMTLTIPARLLDPHTNHRTDEYGGCLENRIRWLVNYCKRVKEVCGPEFIVEVDLCAPSKEPDGFTEEEMVATCKALEGYTDIISLKGELDNPAQDYHSPSSYSTERYPTLQPAIRLTEDLRKNNINIPVIPNGGFGPMDIMEETLAAGKLEMFSLCRGFLANEDYGKLMREGRGEDVVPCLCCNKCHGTSGGSNDFQAKTVCAVNPWFGLEHRKDYIVDKPTEKKNVAVVGGGPAGLRAALYAAERGHEITIYEKSDALGGLLKTVDGYAHKYTLTVYKDWLISQVEKNPRISVMLGTAVTPEFLSQQDYDAVLVGIGGKIKAPDVPGIELAQSCIEAMQERVVPGKNVVIIGGGDTGVDYGVQLAQNGHNVFIIHHGHALAKDSQMMHSYSAILEKVASLPNFSYSFGSVPTKIHADSVEYITEEGQTFTVPADSVFYAVGLSNNNDEAMALMTASGAEAYEIGDCKRPGGLERVNRDALGAATRL